MSEMSDKKLFLITKHKYEDVKPAKLENLVLCRFYSILKNVVRVQFEYIIKLLIIMAVFRNKSVA